jgi:hypothetical protein
MGFDPDFFVRRREAPAEAQLARARDALRAAVETATAPMLRRQDAAALGYRALQDACFESSPPALVGLTFPLGAPAYLECLEWPCETWLPFARELGVAGARLMLVGLATPACGEIRARLA